MRLLLILKIKVFLIYLCSTQKKGFILLIGIGILIYDLMFYRPKITPVQMNNGFVRDYPAERDGIYPLNTSV
jgi:hypothetical protein